MKCLILFASLFSFVATAKVNVVATTTDLQALVASVGGANVEVTSIAKGTQDPHQIEAKPSYMLRFRKADLVVAQGLDLETAWLKPLIEGARNAKLNSGGSGFLELGASLSPIEVATTASRADGDVHPAGNPHFQLDPQRMGQAALLVASRLGELDPANKSLYVRNAEAFKSHLEDRTKNWKMRLEKTGVKEVVTYHKTLSYFLNRFGIQSNLQLEPKPGIPPAASHLVSVINQMKLKNIRVVLIENYFDNDAGAKIKTQIPDAKIFRVPVSVGGDPAVTTTELLVENLVKLFESAK